MRNFITVAILLIPFIALSQKQGQHKSPPLTPIEFNNVISSIADSMHTYGMAWGTLFNEAYDTKNFPILTNPRKKIQEKVVVYIAKLKIMPDVKDSKDLRTAMISFLEFENTMINKSFIPLENLPKDASDDQIKTEFAKLRALATDESAELAKIQVEQEAYAKANGFVIESSESTEEANEK